MKLAMRFVAPALVCAGWTAIASHVAENPRALENRNKNRFFSILPPGLDVKACRYQAANAETPPAEDTLVNPLAEKTGKAVDLNQSVKSLGGLFQEALTELGPERLEKEMSPALLERLARRRGKRAKEENKTARAPFEARLAEIQKQTYVGDTLRLIRRSKELSTRIAAHPVVKTTLEKLTRDHEKYQDEVGRKIDALYTAPADQQNKIRIEINQLVSNGKAILERKKTLTRRLKAEPPFESRPELDALLEVVGDPDFEKWLRADELASQLIERLITLPEEVERINAEAPKRYDALPANEIFYSTWLAKLLGELPPNVRAVLVVQNGDVVGLSYLRFSTAPEGVPPFVVQDLDPTDDRKFQLGELKKRFKIPREVKVEAVRWQECDSEVLDPYALQDATDVRFD